MAILKVHDLQHAVGAIMATRLQEHQEDVFIYVGEELLYAFYHEQDTEVITTCSGSDRVIQALYAPAS